MAVEQKTRDTASTKAEQSDILLLMNMDTKAIRVASGIENDRSIAQNMPIISGNHRIPTVRTMVCEAVAGKIPLLLPDYYNENFEINYS